MLTKPLLLAIMLGDFYASCALAARLELGNKTFPAFGGLSSSLVEWLCVTGKRCLISSYLYCHTAFSLFQVEMIVSYGDGTSGAARGLLSSLVRGK